jgi:hypothetical protein
MFNVAKSSVKQANRAYTEGRFEEAEGFYLQALSIRSGRSWVEERLGLIALWRNDLDSAERYLNGARQHGSWLARRWPISARIDYHLALTHLRQGRIAEAAAVMRRAAGPWPFGPLKALQVQADQLALFRDDGFYRIEGPEVAVIPFVITDPLPVVALSINDCAPVNFFIDTGGEGITLDQAFAKGLGIASVGECAGEYAGGRRGATGHARLERLRLGDIQLSHLPVTLLDLQAISRQVFAGMPIAGILGTGLLMRFLSTLDYPGQRLVLRRVPASRDAADAALGLDGTQRAFPFWLVDTHLIFAFGALNDLAPALMLIDTGLAGAGFNTSNAIYAEAGVALDWSRAVYGEGGGGSVKGLEVAIAQVRLGSGEGASRRTELKGVAMERDHSLFHHGLGFRVEGLISHQFFRDGALTLDFRNMRLILH